MNLWNRIALLELVSILILITCTTVMTAIALGHGAVEMCAVSRWEIKNYGYVGSWLIRSTPFIGAYWFGSYFNPLYINTILTASLLVFSFDFSHDLIVGISMGWF